LLGFYGSLQNWDKDGKREELEYYWNIFRLKSLHAEMDRMCANGRTKILPVEELSMDSRLRKGIKSLLK